MINKGEIVLVEEKAELMHKLGKKQLTVHLHAPIADVPPTLSEYALELAADGTTLTYTYDAERKHPGIADLLGGLNAAGGGVQGCEHPPKLARRHFRQSGEEMNLLCDPRHLLL